MQQSSTEALTSIHSNLLGHSPAMQSLRRLIAAYALADLPVLLEGESGCGKELAARELHALARPQGIFLPVNCSAIPADLLESVLFGHRKGAFTGASGFQRGMFEAADGGILFLDEVGELPLLAQAKLLRVLEDGSFCRLGETQVRQSRARVVAATNRNLREEVRTGRFRADLYHRLSVYAVQLPALRQMQADIPRLLEAFRRRYALQAAQPAFRLASQAEQCLLAYSFPGNVRELRNIVLRLQAKFPGELIETVQVQAELEMMTSIEPPISLLHTLSQALGRGDFSLNAELRKQEQHCIRTALEMAQGNISAAARMLGLQRSTLCSRLDSLQLRGLY